MEGRRTRRAGIRASRAGAVRRAQTQDDRHPRFALHSATVDPVDGSEATWPGEAKISGRAIAASAINDGSNADRFRTDIAEVVQTHLNREATMLVIEWWTPAHGMRVIERE